MKKIITISLAIIAVVVLIVGYLTLVPAKAVVPENEALYSVLANVGIDDALVDVTDERVLVRYNLPEGKDPEAARYFVLGTAAHVAPYSKRIIIQTYRDMEPLEEASVATADVIRIMSKANPTAEDFSDLQARMEVKG